MKKTYKLAARNILTCLLAIILMAHVSKAQVSLTATAGTPTGTFTNLSSAFAAINAGTHQGDIVIDISASFIDVATSVLHSNGAGAALYTSVLIQPVNDGVTISFASASGRGVIELNGADNVTINGDNPNTPGINRNLTIANTALNATTYTSLVRIANSTAVTSSNGNSILNCILNGSATGRNGAGFTSTIGSENTTFGIYCGGNGGTTVTTDPTAITSITTNSAPTTTTINGLVINNNAVNQCARGIVFIGAGTAVSTGVTITNNLIGDQVTVPAGNPPFTTPTTTVYTKGIYIAGTTAVTITGNTLRNIFSYVATQTSGIELNANIGNGGVNISDNLIAGVVCNTTSTAFGIIVSSSASNPAVTGNSITNIQMAGNGSASFAAVQLTHSGTSGLVERNSISRVYNRTTNGWGSYGINITGGTNWTIQNNAIYDVNAWLTNNGLTTSFGPFGIRIAGGTGHRIYYNSVNLFGALVGTTTYSSSAALCVTSNTITGMDIRNNIFSNTLTGALTNSSTTAILFPSGGTSALNLTLNNNAYYQGSGVGAGIAQIGTTAGAGNYQAANFNPSVTTPASNLRSYTSTLNVAGTNDNASVGSSAAAPFVSNTDLHISNVAVNATDVDAKGTPIAGVTLDLDGDTRNATTPDIGVDEFTLPNCAAAVGGTITPGTNNLCAGLSYTVTSTGASPAFTGITYQWEVSATGGGVGFTNVTGGTGANTTSYNTGTGLAPGTYYYRLNVTCSFGPVTAYSNEFVLTVIPSGTPGTAAGPGTGVTGQSLAYTVTGYTVGSTFQWQSSATNGGPYTNIPGATSDTYNATQAAIGTYYYICQVTSGSCTLPTNQVTTVITLAGDDVCGAIPIVVGINGPYSNVGATLQAGEVTPPNAGCNTQNSWCSAANNTVWFSFVAPASGRISMHFLPGNWDSEIAIYSAPNCGALLTGGATLLAANDDSLTVAPFNAFIAPLCVTPGTTYYVQVDGWNATTNANFRLLLKDEGNVPPVITGCPANITVNAAAGLCNAVVNWTAPVATDCPTLTFTSTHTPGSTFPLGVTTVTYTANDGVNAPVLCTFTVTVNDNQNPTITCPANVTANVDAGLCTASGVVLGTPTTADNCGVASITNNAPAIFPAGVTTVTWTVTDVNGNIATCAQTVTVTDNQNPTITCPANVNVNTDPGLCTSSASIGTPTTADNCGVATVTNDAPAAFPLGATAVIWTVTDVNGNVATCIQTVTVTDAQNPSITCPANVTDNTDAGACTAASAGVALGTPVTTDNCGVAFTSNNAPGTYSLGLTTVTWMVLDVNGNSNTCMQNVTIVDAELPTITCPGTVTVNTSPGTCTATGVSLGTPTTADNCGVATVTNDAPAVFNGGNTTVTWTVTDVNGNINTCTQTITVNDNQNPTITCPAAVNANTDAGLCTASGVALGTPTAADNCAVSTVTNDAPAIFPTGTTIVTWTVTDGNGNTATCTQNVTVTDNQIPVFSSCPSNMTVPADAGLCTALVTWAAPVATDNCGGVTTTQTAGLPSGSTFPLGVTNISYTATDGSGNSAICSFTVTVIDAQNPTIVCPANVSANTDAGLCTASGVVLGTPTTADNCGVASTTNNAPATYPVGNTTVTWTVTDINGNTAICNQTVTVTDLQNPTITCPANVTVNTNAGSCMATGVVLGTPVTSDNCGPVSVSNNAPGTYPIGVTIVTWTALDVNGNSSTCNQTVTVTDNENPTIVCPANVTSTTDAASCSSTTVVLGTPVTSDNCTVASITNDAPAAFPTGVTIVTWTVTDGSGNTATCTQTVTVTDNEAPVAIGCSSNITINANNTGCTGIATWVAPTGTDNCGTVNITSTNNSGDAFPVGTTTVTYTFDDGNGNSTTCSFDVTVTNDLSASAVGTDALCNGTPTGNINLTVSGGDPIYLFDWDNDGTGDTDDFEDIMVGAGTYNVTVIDGNGCTATASAAISEPTLLVASITSSTNPSGCGANDGSIDATIIGGTGGYMYDWDNDGTGDNDDTEDLTGQGAGSYVLVVTDANGCTATTTANLSDPNGPTITIDNVTSAVCNGGNTGSIDVTVTLNGGAVSYTTLWDDALATTTDDISGLTAGIYNITVTDNNGCVGSTGVTVTEPTAISGIVSTIDANCFGTSDGTIDLTPSGGTGLYVFDWDNDGTGDNDDTEDLIGLAAGTYTVIVTDGNGCSFTTNTTVNQPTAVTATGVVTNTSCSPGANDGAVNLTPAGGTPTYVYDWDNDGTGDNDDTEDLTGLSAGTYNVTVIDTKGCTSTASFTISTGTPVTFSYSSTLCGGQSVTVGSNTYTTSGVYTDIFVGGAANGCDSTVITNLTVNSPVNVNTSLVAVTITASSTSGNYQWIDCNNGNAAISGETGQGFTATVNGDYAVIVVELGCPDTSACVNIDGVGLTEMGKPTFNVYPNPSTGMFNIESGTNAKAVVVNMLGEQIQSLNIYKGKNQLNLDNIACGPYMLRIVEIGTDEVLYLQRLLIQK